MIHRFQANCQFCAHYLGNRRCKAFSDQIPDALWSGENLHRTPFSGDNGMLFEPKRLSVPPDVESFLSGDY